MTTLDRRATPDEAQEASWGPSRHARRGPRRVWPAFWLPFAVFVIAAFISQRVLFQVSYQAWGDSAVNGLSVLRAEHLQQLVGNYSRVGFHHPGPAYMYLLGGGEVVFFHLLHVVPAPYNGQLLAVSVYVATMLAAICLVVYRSTRSVAATVLTFAVLFAFAAYMPLFGQDWFPFLYVSAFMLLCAAGAATATGSTREWPFLMAAAAFLAHGHASFLMFSAVTLLAVFASWWLTHRGRVRAEMTEHRGALWSTAIVATVACVPVVLDFILHFPGEWPKYLKFTLHGEHAPRTFGDVLDFIATSWTQSSLPIPWQCFVGAALVGAVLLVLDRRPGRRRAFLAVYGLLALESLLYLYYVDRGVDYLAPLSTYIYVGFFYRAVPVILLVAVLAQACLYLADRSRTRRARSLVLGTALGLSLVSCLLVVASGRLERPPAAGQTYTAAATTLTELNAGRPRTIVLQNQVGDVWPGTAAIGLALSRIGARWCTEGPNAVPIMFGDDHICTPTQSRRGMLVAVTNQPLAPRHHAVWQDSASDPRITPGITSMYLPRR